MPTLSQIRWLTSHKVVELEDFVKKDNTAPRLVSQLFCSAFFPPKRYFILSKLVDVLDQLNTNALIVFIYNYTFWLTKQPSKMWARIFEGHWMTVICNDVKIFISKYIIVFDNIQENWAAYLDIRWQFVEWFILLYDSWKTITRDLGTWSSSCYENYFFFKT